MQRIINTSQPTVLNTQLAPLSDGLELQPSGSIQYEQWFYENSGVFLPDRQISPLIITPVASAIDTETHVEYSNPIISIVNWYALEWKGTSLGWVETLIETTSATADYYRLGTKLVIRKNLSDAEHGITIRCVVSYQDPRDSSILHEIEEKFLLTTNLDASVLYPEINVENENTRIYDPLRAEPSTFDFQATSDWSQVTDINKTIIEYKADPLGTEEIIPNNDNGVVTCAPKMDIRYGDTLLEAQQFMSRQISDGQVPTIADGAAKIVRLFGDTVKWNQLVDKNFTYVSAGNMTFSNGVYTVTESGVDTFFYFQNNPIIGHKYYLSLFCSVPSGVTTTYGFPNSSRNAKALVNGRNSWIADYEAGNMNLDDTGGTSYAGTTFSDPMLIDLTLLGIDSFTTTDQVEQWLATRIGAKGSYPDSTPVLIPFKGTAIKSVGFNLWDEECVVVDSHIESKNFIPVLPDTDYYFYVATNQGFYNGAIWYDSNKKQIGNVIYPGNTIHHSPHNAAYMKFGVSSVYGTTYNHDICINLSDPSRNGTYEAYCGGVAQLPVTTIKGKLNGTGSSVVVFADGMKKFGDAVDEISVQNTILKAYKRVGSRAYESGDESDTSVITDGTTTYYALETVQEYVLDAMPRGVFEWYGIQNNQEVLIENLNAYKMASQPAGGGQHTDKIRVDALYAESITVVLRIKRFFGDAAPMPPKVYKSVVWKSHAIEGIVFSENGEMVRAESGTFTFSTIVNRKGQTLSENTISENLRFKWATRKGHLTSKEDKGFARRLTLDKEEVWSTTTQAGQTRMSCCDVGNEIYLLDAYEPLTYNNEPVTYNGEQVFVRPLIEN